MEEIFFYFSPFLYFLLLSSSHFYPFYWTFKLDVDHPSLSWMVVLFLFKIWQIKPYGTEVKYCIRKFLFNHFQWSRFVFVYFVWLLFYSVAVSLVGLKYEMPSSFYHLANVGCEFGCNTHTYGFELLFLIFSEWTSHEIKNKKKVWWKKKTWSPKLLESTTVVFAHIVITLEIFFSI